MRSLMIDESVETKVQARPRWHATGLWLDAADTYELSATGTWVDWKERYRCGPDGYESDSLPLRMTEWARHERSERWFALIGGISRDRRTQFLIGSRRTYRPEVSGELLCFANDIRLMRWNNKGCVTLGVLRVG